MKMNKDFMSIIEENNGLNKTQYCKTNDQSM